MYCLMDMGTTNARVWLYDGEKLLAERQEACGASFGKIHGQAALYAQVRTLLLTLLEDAAVSEDRLQYVLASGMAGSEIGICEIPHLPIPADADTLARHIETRRIPEIVSAPILFVPGLKMLENGTVCDMMRGEETETVGILAALAPTDETVLLLPGTHNKVLSIDQGGTITSCHSTLSGELLDTVLRHTILAGQVDHRFTLSPPHVLLGAEISLRDGLTAALFQVRVTARNGGSVDACSSLLYGAVLGQDIPLIHRLAKNRRIYVGGRDHLQRVYTLLLEAEGILHEPLPREVADRAVCRGLIRLLRQYQAQ